MFLDDCSMVHINTFTYKEIYINLPYIKELLVISFMGVITISTFNSVVYFALNYTQA